MTGLDDGHVMWQAEVDGSWLLLPGDEMLPLPSGGIEDDDGGLLVAAVIASAATAAAGWAAGRRHEQRRPQHPHQEESSLLTSTVATDPATPRPAVEEAQDLAPSLAVQGRLAEALRPSP